MQPQSQKNFRNRTALASYQALMSLEPEETFLAEDGEWLSELGSVLTHTILDFDLVSPDERRDLVSDILNRIGVDDPAQLGHDEKLAEAFLQNVWTFFVERALTLWRAIGGHMELRPGMEAHLTRRFNDVPEGGGALFYVVSGELTVSCEGQDKVMSAGEILVIPQRKSVEFSITEGCDYCSAFNLCFISQSWMDYLPFDQSPYPFLHAALNSELERRSVSDTLTRLIDISHSDLEHRQQMIQNLIELLLIFCKDAVSGDQAEKVDTRVQQACDYIRAHYTDKITIDNIAAVAGISPSALTALFKSHMGMNMMRWRDQLRMHKAVELLEGTDRAIKAIAIDVGYDDPLFFSRRFKQMTGWSPSQIRASRR